MRFMPWNVAFAVALAGACAAPVSAHEFCVDTTAAIQGALTVAATNGEDDEIIIKTGEYQINTDLGAALTFSSTEGHDLSILRRVRAVIRASSPRHTT